MNRNKMNEDENLVDNEDEKEDEVWGDVEDRDKDDDDVSEKNTSKQRTKRQKKNDTSKERLKSVPRITVGTVIILAGLSIRGH